MYFYEIDKEDDLHLITDIDYGFIIKKFCKSRAGNVYVLGVVGKNKEVGFKLSNSERNIISCSALLDTYNENNNNIVQNISNFLLNNGCPKVLTINGIMIGNSASQEEMADIIRSVNFREEDVIARKG